MYELAGGDVELRPIHIEENCGGNELILRRDADTAKRVRIGYSNRNWIDMDEDELPIEFSDGTVRNRDQVVFIPNFQGYPMLDFDSYKELAMEYKIDIRIYIWDQGLEWSSETTWYRNGDISESTRKYADWLWESPLPHYGEIY